MSQSALAQARGEARDHYGDRPLVLIPFNATEACTLKQATGIAGKSEATLRSWCALYDIGRRVANGNWKISRVALAMHLDGDRRALRAYLRGDRSSPLVVQYYERLGIPAPSMGAGHAQ